LLTATFSLLTGIDETAESRIWSQGIFYWNQALEGTALSPTQKTELRKYEHYRQQGFHQPLKRLLERKGLAWRAFPDFRDRTAYLDIETTGIGRNADISVIGVWDGKAFHAFIKDENLESFRNFISNYQYIVTFYGSQFDLPVISSRMGIQFDQIHFDLCFALKRIGYHGGLKHIERQLGIARQQHCVGLTGRDAVRLYQKYERHGDKAALQLLLDYNREDAVNLERLAVAVYNLSSDYCRTVMPKIA
jgi:uncharacterized protein YprB with RNaseH-like and TPR domain